jgi:4-amino-4-deoxy-L-arabinose transferase-like glycosyltransferase
MSNMRSADALARGCGSWHSSFSRWSALLGGLWLIAWGVGLQYRSLGEPDEGRYAEVAREMVATGDWITPRLDGFNFFDKPPLHYWGSAAAYSLFGVHPWSARLWCALTGLLAILMIGWAGARLFGREAGGYAAAILGSSLLFALAAHINTIDMGVTAFLACGMACFLVAQFDPDAAHLRTRLNLLMWAALALAVLSKGLIGVVFPGLILLVYMLWQRDWAVLRRVSLLPGIALLLVICAPWFILMSRLHPNFLYRFFITQQFTRFLTPVFNRTQPLGFFVPVVVLGLFPWTLLLPWSRPSWRAVYAGLPAQRFLLTWTGVIFVFFSASHSKLPFYILPLFPALALLLGAAAAALTPAAMLRRFQLVIAIAGLGAIAAVASMFMLRTKVAEQALQDALVGLALALLLIAAAAIFGARVLRHGRRRTAMHLLALAAIVGWQGVLISSQSYVDMTSAAPVARIIKPQLGPATEVFTVRTYLGGLPFYLGRLVTVVDQHRDDLAPGLASRPAGYIADVATFEQRWRTSDDAITVAPASLLPQFRDEGLPFHELGWHAGYVIISRHATGEQAAAGPRSH